MVRSSTYQDLSRRLVEDEWVADEVVIGKPEVGGAHNGQIDALIRASLNGDTLATIRFSVFQSKIGHVHAIDHRGEGADPTLMAQLMLALQKEFPRQYIPGLGETPGYELLRFIEIPDYEMVKRYNRAKELKGRVAKAREAALKLEGKPERTEREMKTLSSIWDQCNADMDELYYLIHRGEGLPEDWETGSPPRLRIIHGIKRL